MVKLYVFSHCWYETSIEKAPRIWNLKLLEASPCTASIPPRKTPNHQLPLHGTAGFPAEPTKGAPQLAGRQFTSSIGSLERNCRLSCRSLREASSSSQERLVKRYLASWLGLFSLLSWLFVSGWASYWRSPPLSICPSRKRCVTLPVAFVVE